MEKDKEDSSNEMVEKDKEDSSNGIRISNGMLKDLEMELVME